MHVFVMGHNINKEILFCAVANKINGTELVAPGT